MATTVVSSGTLGNVTNATGMSNQNRPVFGINSDRWFWFFIDAADNTTVNCYVSSSNDLTSCTWAAISSNPVSPALGGSKTWNANEGRNLAVAYKNIAATDVVYLQGSVSGTSATASTFWAQAIRLTVTSSAATWGTWLAQTANNGNLNDTVPHGTAIEISTTNRAWAVDNRFTSDADAARSIASNTDSGTSWTTGWGAGALLDNSMANTVNSGALAPLASGLILGVFDNGAVTATTTNHIFQKSSSNSAWPANTTLGTIASAMGTAQDKNDWCMRGVTTTDVHLVRRTGTTSFQHLRYNGTNWTSVSGASIPTSGVTGQLAGSGIGLSTDGTDLWMFIIDTNANKDIKYIKWTASGNAWDASWSTLSNTNTNTKKFISVSQVVGNGQIGVFWTENASTPFAIVGSALVLSSPPTNPAFPFQQRTRLDPWWPARVWAILR